MLIAFSVVLVPLRAGATLLLAATGYGAIAIPVLASEGIGPHNVDLFVFTLLCCTAPILIKLRSDRVQDSNFLLTLESRRSQDDLLASNRRLETLSSVDALTAVLNRRGFENRFAAAFAAAREGEAMLAVLLLDIDHFKRFNDTHGHQAGDRCLREVGRLLNSECERHGGFAGRYGGDEFIAALVGEASREAGAIATRIGAQIGELTRMDDTGIGENGVDETGIDERGIEDADSDHRGPEDSIRVSIGVRIGSPRTTSRETFVSDADRALYAAKDAGRNRVVVLGDKAKSAAS
jgi:diguanylate cyclase (GGDEF)-like protein